MSTADQENYGYNSEQAAKFVETQQLAEIERQKAVIELAQKKQKEALDAAAQHEQQVANQVDQQNTPPTRFAMEKVLDRSYWREVNPWGGRQILEKRTVTNSEMVTVLRRESDGLHVRYDYGNECSIKYYNLPVDVRRSYGFPMSRP